MANLKQTNSFFRLSCGVGFLLSCYALFVELKTEEDKDYEAYCDMHEYISCTKAFSSEYGKGFGIIRHIFGEDSYFNQPNSVGGIAFYLLLMFMSLSDQEYVVMLQTVFCFASNLISIYLAYILYYILQNFCVVCVGTYAINIINLALSFSKWNLVRKLPEMWASSNKKSTLKKQ